MNNFLEEIKNKVKEKFKAEDVVIIDNSYLHKKHKSFDVNKFHLKLIIKCSKLKKMNSIESNRTIFSLLKNELKNKIHALQIEIK